jgi:hypothetical protein
MDIFYHLTSEENKRGKAEENLGANATTFEFTTTTPVLNVVGLYIFQSSRKYSCFQNALGYPWYCNFLQRWRRIGSRHKILSSA